MNTLFKLMALSAIAVSPATLMAQNIEQIYMKSGSVVEGYIAEQKPGEYISIQTEKATIVVNNDSLQNRISEKIPLDSLSSAWAEWAKSNNKIVEHNGAECIEMSTLEFENCTYNNVFLLEKGSLIKFLDLTPNIYKFVWGDMYRTVKSARPKNLFSGLRETIVLKNGTEVSGQIIEQFPGKDLKIVTDNEEVLSYKLSQIEQIRTEKLNEDADLWSQVRLLDKITIKGKFGDLVGFISSRTLGKEMTIEFEDGSKHTIKQSEIASYAKIPNEKYVELYDKFLNKGEVLLNGKPAYFMELEQDGKYLMLAENTASAMLNVGDTVCLEANFDDPNTLITLVKAHERPKDNNSNKKNNNAGRPAITYQDLLQSPITIKREITPLKNVKVTFEIAEAGDYVLYIQGYDKYIVIYVPENM